MCGIVGCVGHEHAIGYVTSGLEALEYRGYDSAGLVFPGPNHPRLEVIKALGGPKELTRLVPIDAEATTALGHNRWATHGEVTVANAHPQVNTAGTIAVVHNGTIENHDELREDLRSLGYDFISETDTEVIPHLFDYYLKEGQEPDEAFTNAAKRLVGAYAILAYYSEDPETLYAARRGSPLVLGVKGGERFAASDPRVVRAATRWVDFMEENELARLSSDETRYKTWSIEGHKSTREPQRLDGEVEIADKGGFEYFMLKEIYEAPQTVRAAISGRVRPGKDNLEPGWVKLGGLEDPEIQERLAQTKRFAIVGCGTSYHAGLIGERLIEEVAGMPAEVHVASEFQYRQEPLDPSTAVLAITQSGETADTVGALEKAKAARLLTLGINNTPGSTIDRLTDAGVHCRAGLEVSVASTKAFISQVTVLTEIALALGRGHPKTVELQQRLMAELVALPDKIEQILGNTAPIEAAARKYAQYNNFLYLGRGYEHVSAMEGALKLKEISYIHAEAYSAGEMKHGPIALIDEDFPTFAIATEGPVYDKVLSNISEIKSRKGRVIALATEGNDAIQGKVDDVLYVPASLEQTQPVLNAVAMQLFAYYATLERELDPDHPRNLAKSVTVE